MTTEQQTKYFKFRYDNDPAFKELRLRLNREWKSRNKLKLQAEHKIDYLIRTGKLKRKPCEICNKFAYAHHPDYDKPLIVVWLCPKHHTQVHKGILSLERVESRNRPVTRAA